MLNASDWEKRFGVAMLICCCSAAENLSLAGAKADRVTMAERSRMIVLSFIF